jgi:hypothetical protein
MGREAANLECAAVWVPLHRPTKVRKKSDSKSQQRAAGSWTRTWTAYRARGLGAFTTGN